VTFEEWWDKFALTEINGNLGYNARKIWEAAQQAERERTIGIMLKHVGSSMRPWNECVVDAIDEITGVRKGSELEP
jgi:hypothetical protein